MRIKPFTKQEVQKVYKIIEQTLSEISGIKGEEAEHIEGILIIGFRDDDSFSSSNIGQIKFGNLINSFAQLSNLFYKDKPKEKPKYAE